MRQEEELEGQISSKRLHDELLVADEELWRIWPYAPETTSLWRTGGRICQSDVYKFVIDMSAVDKQHKTRQQDSDSTANGPFDGCTMTSRLGVREGFRSAGLAFPPTQS